MCLRKWQWEMYSPSGSKRFQLKRNWAYSRVGLAVCRLVYTEALRPFCALRSLPVAESRDSGLVRVFKSVQALILLYSGLYFSFFLSFIHMFLMMSLMFQHRAFRVSQNRARHLYEGTVGVPGGSMWSNFFHLIFF